MDQTSENNHLEHISTAMYKLRDYVLHVLSFLLYRFTRSLIVTFQKFTWAVSGVEKICRDARRGLQFRQSAHVLDIFWKRKFLPHTIADPKDFIATHSCFKHPNYVLKPNVSLYCMTKTDAIFIEVAEGANLYKHQHNKYLYETQFEHAKKIVMMPLASFHKIASDVGNPKVPVLWISSTGRCGSTLLGQVFYRIPGMLLLSEPDSITNLGNLYKSKELQKGEYEQLLASAVRLLCKPDDRYSMMCIKVRPSMTRLSEEIAHMFPQIRQLFMYRNSLKTVLSYLTILQTDPAYQAMRFIMDHKVLSTILPFFRTGLYNYYANFNAKEIESIKPSNLSTVGIFTAAWAAGVSRCVEYREKGLPIIPILYEDLMKNPMQSCLVLFTKLDIRKEYVSLAAEAFKVDYQKSSVLGQGLLPPDSRRAIPPEGRVEADSILKKYGLHKLGERFEIPGLMRFE
ncbi:hypothetical protein LOTGIDRAFT_236217 [Lottia gigantea]|uniref:Sulfotransferase domain-containing protein n=1 Tax=Lottia gigantea TaxID=225164 RepID=V3Z1W9_LOTGI|nr:hypothetical protein LOTGIDRAFT_236217 [Lottia gigantea]ESO84548.1 hypothetical protein LOTGIDRAFT_236217 [Lottia gigantea]